MASCCITWISSITMYAVVMVLDLLSIVLWNQRLPPARAEANYGAVRHRGICCTFPIMPRMPLNFLPADGSLGERWEGGQREGRWGGQKKLGPSLAILGCFPLSFLCLYHYLKDSHHVFHLYRSAQLRALSVWRRRLNPRLYRLMSPLSPNQLWPHSSLSSHHPREGVSGWTLTFGLDFYAISGHFGPPFRS